MGQHRLAVFDCDGTLVDSQHSIVNAMETAFGVHKLESPVSNDVRRIIGLPLEQAIGILAPGTEPLFHSEVAETYKSVFRDLRASGGVQEPLYPGVKEVLAKLDGDGWMLGIATGKAMRGLIATLEPYGLVEYFVTRQTADIAMGKPHPDMLEKAMSETGVDASQTVMVGDTTYDMEMAQNAGTRSVGVSWGYHPREELFSANADTVIDEFGVLIEALETLTEDRYDTSD